MTPEDTDVVVDLCAVMQSQSLILRKTGGLCESDIALLRAGEATIEKVRSRVLVTPVKVVAATEKS